MKFIPLIILTTTALFGVTLNQKPIQNSLIVYNSGIGLIHENRELNIKKNESEIIYEDVAPSIDTDSVNINLPEGVSLYSQQYRFDKLTQKKLIDAHIGKNIVVKVMKDSTNFTTIHATLLSGEADMCIVKSSDKSILTVESANIIFQNIPSELITKPSLVWNIQTKKNIESKMSIDYLISQIGWKSNYILNLKKDKADLSGWITIDNRSGKSFNATELHVLAGDINKAVEPREYYRATKAVMMVDSMPEVAHQAHEGYHFYTIPFKVNLANNEKTQIKFITQNDIDAKRKYSSNMSNPNYLRGEVKHDVSQYVTIKELELPLPKGIIRSYSKLKNTNILLGESSLAHTPKNTPISIRTGKNFDVKVKETLIKKDDRKHQLDVDVKYSIKNSSDETKMVEILVPFNKNERSDIKSDEIYTFTKGTLVTFNIEVEPNGTKEFEAQFKTKK